MDRLNDNWQLLLRTDNYTEAAILRGMLEGNDIPVMVVNKQDSSYVFLGEQEIYVPAHLKSLAEGLVQGNLAN
jgi:hypothetical protein